MYYLDRLLLLLLIVPSIEVLKDEFNTIPIKYIRETQKEKKHLYATYLALNEAKQSTQTYVLMARHPGDLSEMSTSKSSKAPRIRKPTFLS